VKSIDTIWVLIAAFLVFIMHAGFAMVETGFTRAKNAVNIIMKNLLTVAIGVVTFYFVGFALMFGQDVAGFLGITGFGLQGVDESAFTIPMEGFWFFQAVFAATSATIVSGAVAERTKFLAYCLFTVGITSVTYPIVGHWIWGGGWLFQKGFIDLAGSTVVHSVGGWSALVGAYLVGARLNKFTPDGKINVIPGHNFPLGALGVFLLWFGWFGFNPGSTLSGMTSDIAHIATTTLLAGAAGTIGALAYTWIAYGKPDASLTLNGALAGLVAITAGAQVVTAAGSLAIGALAGIILVISVGFVEKVLRIDDPVGAISVHGVCGSFGTLCVGLFAKETGLLYGGGAAQLITQAIGVASVAAWSLVLAYLMFTLLKVTVGIRVTAEEELEGLDLGEHGLEAYENYSLNPKSIVASSLASK
jgi:Amt family ammonium transporter